MLYENAADRELLTLVARYNSGCGENWRGIETWLNGTLSSWEGVTVSWVKNDAETDSTMRITHIDFKSMTLTGTLPLELGNLTEMSGKIELNNQPGLTGTLPALIWKWVNVERMQVTFMGFTAIDLNGIENRLNLFWF